MKVLDQSFDHWIPNNEVLQHYFRLKFVDVSFDYTVVDLTELWDYFDEFISLVQVLNFRKILRIFNMLHYSFTVVKVEPKLDVVFIIE